MIKKVLQSTRNLAQQSKFFIAVGDRLPPGSLTEYIDVEGRGCKLGPNAFNVIDLAANKNIAFFAVPGAFTPTCSSSHVPDYLRHSKDFFKCGIDEIWCLSVNDAFVMGAWGKQLNVDGKIRMLADGNAAYTKELEQVFDLTSKGLGIRSQRYSMLISNGIVRAVNQDEPGQFKVSGAEILLNQAKSLLK